MMMYQVATSKYRSFAEARAEAEKLSWLNDCAVSIISTKTKKSVHTVRITNG